MTLFLESLEIIRNAWAAIRSGEITPEQGREVILNTLSYFAERMQR